MQKLLMIVRLRLPNMRFNLFIIFLGLTLATAAPIYSQNVRSGDAVVAPTPTKVKLDLRGSVTDEQKHIMELGRNYLEKAINDPSFGERLLKLKFTSTRFRKSNGIVEEKSNEDILKIIREGIERPNRNDEPKPKNQIELRVVLVPKKKPTVGSTVLGKLPIRTGYWFVNAAARRPDAVSIARHLMHEWLHVAGFYHYPDNSARGDVPYEVGSLVRDLLHQNNKLRKSATEESLKSLLFGEPFAQQMISQAEALGEDSVMGMWLDEAEDETDIGDEDDNQ